MWHLDRCSSDNFFPLSMPFHQCLIPVFFYMLVLPEDQTGEVWNLPIIQCSFGNRGTVGIKLLSLFSSSEGYCRLSGRTWSSGSSPYFDSYQLSRRVFPGNRNKTSCISAVSDDLQHGTDSIKLLDALVVQMACVTGHNSRTFSHICL
jgi:hypothetical protein